MGNQLVKFYDLRQDGFIMATYQNYTKEERAGLVPENGLFGSAEWWEAIENYQIPTYTIDSTIFSTDFFEGQKMGEGDCLEFTVRELNCKETWYLSAAQADIYKLKAGQPIKLKYVLQKRQGSGEYIKILMDLYI